MHKFVCGMIQAFYNKVKTKIVIDPGLIVAPARMLVPPWEACEIPVGSGSAPFPCQVLQPSATPAVLLDVAGAPGPCHVSRPQILPKTVTRLCYVFAAGHKCKMPSPFAACVLCNTVSFKIICIALVIRVPG